jgi:hypothetical protein
MSKIAKEKAMLMYPIDETRLIPGPFVDLENPSGNNNVYRREGFVKGYEQAEKDLALTPEDILRIVDLYDECLILTFEEGKPAYESEEFYAEVLRRFLEQRKK